eukprot:scaffold95949_cov56-Phaeocystis_antarctica.AAC.1
MGSSSESQTAGRRGMARFPRLLMRLVPSPNPLLASQHALRCVAVPMLPMPPPPPAAAATPIRA